MQDYLHINYEPVNPDEIITNENKLIEIVQ